MITKQTPLIKILEIGKECKRCGHCCKHGSGFLAGDGIKKISGFLQITEKELKKDFLEEIEKFNTKRYRPVTIKKGKPYGVCTFYTADGCRIQPVKPLECKVGNCNQYGEQLSIWFALNYFVNKSDPESIRQYAIYLKTHNTIPGGRLEELVPDKEELKEILEFKKLR